MNVLVVDDNAYDRKILRYNFERHGYEVEEAVNGREALEAARRRAPDLIISDALMPETDGFQLLREIKKDTGLRDIPFVFYSAVYQGAKEEELALSLGAEAFLVKPQEPEDLWRKVSEVVAASALSKKPPLRDAAVLAVDEDFLRRYSQVVVDTLETKVKELSREIEERKRSEAALRDVQAGIERALKEKEALLREIHHRVKNNMQVISSLLHLQAQNYGREDLTEMFDETQRRIRSIALVHEKLYQSPDLSRIDFGGYLESLVANLYHAHRADANLVVPRLNAERITIDIQTAVPLGLLISELVSNALKFAFPGGRAGELRIDFRRSPGGGLKLALADTGVGLPKGLDVKSATTMGFQLLSLFVDQLDGILEVRTGPNQGTEFTVSFKEQAYPRRI